MSIFEQNEALLEELEQAESLVEKARIQGVAAGVDRLQVASRIKTCVAALAENIRAAGGDIQALGGALVVPDLIEVLGRYSGVFDIEGLDSLIEELERMWNAAG
ncbi:hypothetical protein LLH00_13600 [bacterium]|nr:hypothetical protein [bacterium]